MVDAAGATAADLARLPLFADVDRSDLEDLCRVAPPVVLAAGTPVFAQGARADVALLVVAGELEVAVGEGGRRTVLGKIAPGEVVGELALVEPERTRLATVTATRATTCILLSPDLLAVVTRNAAWAAIERHLLRSLVRRVRETERALHEAWKAAQPAPDRPAARAAAAPSLRERLRGFVGRGT